MKKIITYGTYDLLHEGHLNLLRRAKELGDYLIVGVTSDTFDRERGKLNVHHNVLSRVQSVIATGIADEVIIEEYVGQKIDDIQHYQVDTFAIGSDWEGHFDYLSEYCNVVYLPRTEGISSTQLRAEKDQIFKLGIIGTGRIAHKFIHESDYVNTVIVQSVYNPTIELAQDFQKEYELPTAHNDLTSFFDEIDAVYIASPHQTHYEYIKQALCHNKHVLCEIPLVLSKEEAVEVYKIALDRELVLLEASKTAFCPGFLHLVSLVKTGVIGDVVDVQASLSKLVDRSYREFDELQAGGSMTELAPLPLMAIIKLLGINVQDINFFTRLENGVDIFTKGILTYKDAIATVTLGLGVKTEGNLVISGTKGYVYVPSPWWKTEYFELRFEDQNLNRKFYYRYEEHGLRYEIQEFITMILSKRLKSFKLKQEESIAISGIIDHYRQKLNINLL